MIPQSEISRLAAQQQKLDRIIEKDYVITWILIGLSDAELSDLLAFKGGTALKKAYFPDYRFSEDLDYTLLERNHSATLIGHFRDVLERVAGLQGFQFEVKEEKIETRSDSFTFYIDYVGPLQGRLGSRDIKVDITLEEILGFPLDERRILSPYSDSMELATSVKVYSLEEVMIEKLCAIIARTEPRDLYDLRFLFELGGLDYQSVAYAFPDKARHNDIDASRLRHILSEKKPTLARLWENRLAHQVGELPHLDATIRLVNKGIRQLLSF